MSDDSSIDDRSLDEILAELRGKRPREQSPPRKFPRKSVADRPRFCIDCESSDDEDMSQSNDARSTDDSFSEPADEPSSEPADELGDEIPRENRPISVTASWNPGSNVDKITVALSRGRVNVIAEAKFVKNRSKSPREYTQFSAGLIKEISNTIKSMRQDEIIVDIIARMKIFKRELVRHIGRKTGKSSFSVKFDI